MCAAYELIGLGTEVPLQCGQQQSRGSGSGRRCPV